MVAYRQSDVKLSWEHSDEPGLGPKVCGYVKEGAGMLQRSLRLMNFH